MVFVWSYLSGGNAIYTLVQVAVNDLILLVAFVPIVQILLGITLFVIPFDVLLTSVVIFACFPLLAGYLTQLVIIKRKGKFWLEHHSLSKFKPVSIIALLSTLLLLFAFQSKSILQNPFHILLIAIPLTL
jgi:ACR3 family arsenite transporter